ncbi:MAG: M28 family peptidase [Deltaproteobacteria bacterium]|nr:M28 family peptidase [Candidatus Zymogenaceae bacterium]
MKRKCTVMLWLCVIVMLWGSTASALDTERVPDTDTIMGWVDDLCVNDNRRVGELGGFAGEDYFFERLTDLGLTDVRKEPIYMDVWRADDWSLTVDDGGESVEIPASFCVYTGFTPAEGVSGELVYVGRGSRADFRGRDVTGKIVVADMDFGSMPYFPVILLKGHFFYDPDRTLRWWDSQVVPWSRKNWRTNYLEEDETDDVYSRALNLGAAGLIWILADQPTNNNTNYALHDGVMKDLPALYVGKRDGALLRERADKDHVTATLTQTGSIEKGIMHEVYGTLPGISDEAILITCHHDAPYKGYIQDATGMAAVLAIAEYFSGLPREDRPRTLIFLANAGHFYGDRGIEVLVERHRNDFFSDVVLTINLEQVAAGEFVERPDGEYEPTGLPQPRVVMVPKSDVIVDSISDAIRSWNLTRSIVVPLTAFSDRPPGAVRPIFDEGIPVIQYISGPVYLLSDADTREKIDQDELVPTVSAFIEIIEFLSVAPKESLGGSRE